MIKKHKRNSSSFMIAVKTILPIYVTIVSLFLAVYAIYYKQTTTRIKPVIENYQSVEIDKMINIIKEYEQMIKAFKISKEDTSAIAMENKLIKIEKKINDIDQQTIALRQAINPIKPEEMLTIARLKDEVIILRKRIDEIYDMQKREQDYFRNAIARELDASGRTTYLIVAILVPLALTFSYTIWKDRREEKKEKISKQEKGD